MSTWLEDLEKKDPKLASDWKIVGNQSLESLRNMVKALESLPLMNMQEDDERLRAAKRILKKRKAFR